ncbi:MAG: hypothetical protein ACREPC_06415 [Stenotrophomonas sp.]|uniref:hypothetical protein n=1 Tax=Stenotrophomonas sp. TaxID=69392 RepID=UPI003D6D96D4
MNTLHPILQLAEIANLRQRNSFPGVIADMDELVRISGLLSLCSLRNAFLPQAGLQLSHNVRK